MQPFQTAQLKPRPLSTAKATTRQFGAPGSVQSPEGGKHIPQEKELGIEGSGAIRGYPRRAVGDSNDSFSALVTNRAKAGALLFHRDFNPHEIDPFRFGFACCHQTMKNSYCVPIKKGDAEVSDQDSPSTLSLQFVVLLFCLSRNFVSLLLLSMCMNIHVAPFGVPTRNQASTMIVGIGERGGITGISASFILPGHRGGRGSGSGTPPGGRARPG